MKKRRQQAILDLVERLDLSSQGDIVRELATVGIDANQATVSRDIQDLGLIKVPDSRLGHRYALPGATRAASWEDIADTLREHVTRVDGNESLIVIKTPPGRAHLVAVSIDGLRQDDILGTIAGDDTLLLVPRNTRARAQLMTVLDGLLQAPRRSRTQAAGRAAAATSR